MGFSQSHLHARSNQKPQVRIDGISVVEEPERARELVGYVPDALPARRDMPLHDYLDLFARAYAIKGARRPKVIEGIEEFTNLHPRQDVVRAFKGDEAACEPCAGTAARPAGADHG